MNEYDLEQVAFFGKQAPELPKRTHIGPCNAYERDETVRRSVLLEAERIVNGDRANTYGGPEDSFRTIAGLWNAYLDEKQEITPADVAIMLGLLKVARLKNSPNHRDSWVDLAGYAACGAECGLK